MADPRRTEESPFDLLYHWVYDRVRFFSFHSNFFYVYSKIVIKNLSFCHIYINYLVNKYT